VKKAAVLLVLVASLVVTTSAQATFQGGGKKPSEAATIEWGQRYVGELDNHKESANYGGYDEVSFWRLPAVSTRDEVIVNWQSVPYTGEPGDFPVCMMIVQGINDSSWGEAFDGGSCSGQSGFAVSGSGTAASKVTIQDSDSSGNTYLEFWCEANREAEETSRFETYQYNFTVERPRHYLNMTLSPFSEVAANGTVSASVTSADGSPAPDGLTFGLTVRWNEGGTATYSATSAGGRVTFQLALPESAYKKNVGFIGGRGADAEYQAVETPVVHAKVSEPSVPPPTPPLISSTCKRVTARAHVLARQHHRLARNAHRARGIRRGRLHRRAWKIGIKLRRARSKAAAACA
jgi:hypothetical protein